MRELSPTQLETSFFARVSIAPMMAYTDRHFRYLMRLINPQVRLYTEMLTANAVVSGDSQRLLAYHPAEHPLALQLGGCDPFTLAQACRIAATHGFDEINLNVGCPSGKVQQGQFGACLMKQPQSVVDCVLAMQAAVNIPITIKTRLGVDDYDSYDYLVQFIQQLAATGCQNFIIHARKAWLKGLSPKQNREIPPLRYDWVYRLKRDFPHLQIIINGGVSSLSAIKTHLAHVDGVMLGRAAYKHPLLLSTPSTNLCEVVQRYCDYIDQQLAQGTSLSLMLRHVLGLSYGQVGAKNFRRALSSKNKKNFGDFRLEFSRLLKGELD